MGKGRTPCCEKGRVKKGPWSQYEDLKLISFIQRHGHSNWRSLPKLAGLARCGKSCRLRWVNYLRPDVNRGSLTPDEEETIMRLQSLLGNKWSKIASHLPGRTDNEIKNIWNTHLKKRSTDKKSNKPDLKSTHHDQDKISYEPSSYNHGNKLHFHGQGLAPSMSPKDNETIEFSCSDYHDVMINVARKMSYDEPNLVDLWDSLLLDEGDERGHQLNPNIHGISDGKQSSQDLEGDASAKKKDFLAGSNCSWPVGLLDNLELGKINNDTTSTTNYGACQQFVDEQMSKSDQVEAFSNDGFLKIDNNMESYLHIMAWPSSPTCYSFSGF